MPKWNECDASSIFEMRMIEQIIHVFQNSIWHNMRNSNNCSYAHRNYLNDLLNLSDLSLLSISKPKNVDMVPTEH